MKCEKCAVPLSPMTAKAFQPLGKPKRILCASCASVAAAIPPDPEPGHVVRLEPRYSYHFISLNSTDGHAAVEQKLNAWGERGWRLLPISVCGGNMGILERESRA
jgi:hypothetical protein